MKKLLLILICLLTTYTSPAQTYEQHFEFMGIPIDGSPQEFGNSLEQKGFKYIGDNDKNQPMYTGFFAGYKCTLGVSYHNNSVYMVVVIPDIDKSLSTLLYKNLKDNLAVKYGQPRNSVEHENGGAITIFSQQLGDILLTKLQGQVGLSYRDFANLKKFQSAAVNDL